MQSSRYVHVNMLRRNSKQQASMSSAHKYCISVSGTHIVRSIVIYKARLHEFTLTVYICWHMTFVSFVCTHILCLDSICIFLNEPPGLLSWFDLNLLKVKAKFYDLGNI